MGNTLKNYGLFLCHLNLCLCSLTLQANPKHALICSVDGSQDDFKVYSEQLVFTSREFSHYQLIDGLTILVVNHKTMRFNRLTNLNLLPHSTMDPNRPVENYQLFTGSCKASEI